MIARSQVQLGNGNAGRGSTARVRPARNGNRSLALLTQRLRLNEALLLKTKREKIAGAWLAPSPLMAATGVTIAVRFTSFHRRSGG